MSNNRHVQSRVRSSGQSTEMTSALYRDIVPPPEMMRKLQQIDAALPGRLVTWMEEEAKHRRECEKIVLRDSNRQFFCSNIAAFLSILAICGVAYLFMINGNSQAGAAIAVGTIVAVAGVFVIKGYRKESPQPEKELK